MKKKLKEHIEKLLRLYDEARTSDEQERELADFFSQPHDDQPEEWTKYATLFSIFAKGNPLFSETELEEMTAPLPHRSRRVWPWTLGAAATIALLIGFFLYHPKTTEAPDYLAIAEQPTPNMEELDLTSADSALAKHIAELTIVPYSAHLGDSNNVMRLRGTRLSKADPDSLSALLCVSVNGELFLDSLNFLALLHKDEIRDYFLSQGKVLDDIWCSKEESYIISKYGYLPKSKGKQMIMEITLKESLSEEPMQNKNGIIEKKEGSITFAEAEPKTEPAPMPSPTDEVRIGQAQVKKTVPQLTFKTPTLDISNVFALKDSTFQERVAKLDIVFNSAEMGDPENIVQLGDTTINTSDYYFGVSKPEDKIELRIEQDMLLTFNDRMLYGIKAGGGGEGVRVQIPTNYKVSDSLQTLSTEDTIQINSTYKNDVVFGTLSLERRESFQTWEHRNSGYDWNITPYQEYQDNLLNRLGISITFPESTVRYFSHLGEMEDYALFTFGTADASGSWTHFNGRMFVQMSPSFCIVLYDTGNYDYPHAFENRESMVRREKLTLDTEVAYFDHLIRNNLDIPWTGWYDYSGEDLQKLQEWDGANYILKFKEASWVKRSNAEMGLVAKIPNFKRIQYNGEKLSENNIGSSYNACYGVELSRLYNPESILMLFFINTEEEKDILKCLEEACKYVSFDNSHIKEAPTREDTDINILAPDTTTLELTPSDKMSYGRKAG